VELVHKPWTTSGVGPWWTATVQPRVQWRTHQSTVRRCYGSPAVAARGGGWRGGCGGAGGALTRDRATVKQPSDGDKAAVMKARGGGKPGAREVERGAVWGAAR
jgi:hypothetical protein